MLCFCVCVCVCVCLCLCVCVYVCVCVCALIICIIIFIFRDLLSYATKCIGSQIKAFSFLFCTASSAASKYYSSVSHHDQKNKKITDQIKFSAVTIRQQIKLVLQHSLSK